MTSSLPIAVILLLYILITLLIGWYSSRKVQTANAYLNASRSLPLWIVALAYLAANCGALDVVGMSAAAAQYGIQAFHFYWIGAIPAMVFLAFWMMPVYRRSKADSVPGFLEARFRKPVRLMNACVTAVMMVLLGGVSLYAMAQVLAVMTRLSFLTSILLCALIVLSYVLSGGVRATIYNEVFQLLVIVSGLVPMAIRSARMLWGQNGIRPEVTGEHLWTGLPLASNAAPLDATGVVFGLGFVLSFGYWCTDFVLMQRAFSARTEHEAREVPLWAGLGKLVFSMLVVLPGLAARRMLPALGLTDRFDHTLPAMMMKLYGPYLLGLGMTALTASLMSGLAANVSAFAAVWTEDIYRTWLRPGRSDRHYLVAGRFSVVTAMVLSLCAAYLNFLFHDLMEHVQLIFAIMGSPFFAIFLIGMSSRRVGLRGAVAGLSAGMLTGVLHLLAYVSGWLHYGSTMNANFHTAIYSFCATCLAAFLTPESPQTVPETSPLLFRWRLAFDGKNIRLWVLAGVLLLATLSLNLALR